MSDPVPDPLTAAEDPADGGTGSASAAPGLVRQARGLAVATIASRVTGFARIAALTAVLGVGGLRQAFDVSNTLPNTVYELLLGGVLTSTLVPLLVEARAGGAAKAAEFTRQILSVVLLATGVLSVVAVLAAPLLVRAYSGSPDPDEIALSIRWARFFLPQILFYGLTATVSAVLNAQARFGAAVWAPVLNNVVVLATVGVFALLPGAGRATVATLTEAQLLTLGIGTTLGVIAMTLALLPSLHASGFRWRLRLDLRGIGLRRIGRLGAWVLLYVAATQASYFVLVRLATAGRQLPTYTIAFTLWQLPHAVVAVSVITALLPRMSAHAVAGRLPELRGDLDRGLRLAAILLVPSAAAFIVLGRDISIALFAHGATTIDQAHRVGWVVAVFAVGLLPFSAYQLQARAFYALRDTRTPALVQCAVSAVLVVIDVVLALVLPLEHRVFGLAAGHAVAYLVGVRISAVALDRRLGPRAAGSARIGRLAMQLGPAVLLAGAGAAGIAAALHPQVSGGPLGALAVLAAAGAGGALVYGGAITAFRLPEAVAALRASRKLFRLKENGG